MPQVSGAALIRLPMTRIGGKRYSGLPSTYSPVNTPTYGAGSKGEPPGCGTRLAAQPASSKTSAAATATLSAAILDCGDEFIASNVSS